MITSAYLRSMGYTPIKSATIMQCLRKLGCEVKNTRIHSYYHKNGTRSDFMYFGNAVSRLEAITALSAYLSNLPKEANRNTWAKLLSELKNKEEVQ